MEDCGHQMMLVSEQYFMWRSRLIHASRSPFLSPDVRLNSHLPCALHLLKVQRYLECPVAKKQCVDSRHVILPDCIYLAVDGNVLKTAPSECRHARARGTLALGSVPCQLKPATLLGLVTEWGVSLTSKGSGWAPPGVCPPMTTS